MLYNNRAIKNILAVRNDRFGEFLLNIPAFRALKQTFTNARLIAAVNPSVKELAQSIPFIDETIEWSQGKHSLLEKINLIYLLRKMKIDIAVMLNPLKDFNIFTYLVGIPIRAGYNRKWGFLLTHKMEDKKHLGERHEVEYNLELVSLIGAKTDDPALSLSIEEKEADGLLKEFNIKRDNNIIALHPWTSDPIKQWPLESFHKLAERLLKENNIAVAIIGGKSELAKSIELFEDADSRLVNLTGKTTLIQLAALLKKCRLLVSGDSGPVHLAAALGVPVIAIFRNDIPGKGSQRWGPWGRGNVVIEKNNLCDITADEVFDMARRALGG